MRSHPRNRGGTLPWVVPTVAEASSATPPCPRNAPLPSPSDLENRTATHEGHPTTAGIQIPKGSSCVGWPHVAPDGEWLTFASCGRQEDIFVALADGSGRSQLTSDASKNRGPRWSPDGKTIAFYSDRSGSYELWTINSDGSGLRQLTDTPGKFAAFPIWSPEGTRMILQSPASGGAVFIFEPGKPWSEQSPQALPRVSDEGRFEVWSWSPDGKRLAATVSSTRATSIVIYDLETQGVEVLTDFGSRPIWLRDGRRLLFHSEGKIFLADTESKEYHEVLSLDSAVVVAGQYSLSRDDRTIYFARIVRESDIWMLTLN